jgi:hypothetical protein
MHTRQTISGPTRVHIDLRDGYPEELSIHDLPAKLFDAIPAPEHRGELARWKIVCGVTFFTDLEA